MDSRAISLGTLALGVALSASAAGARAQEGGVLIEGDVIARDVRVQLECGRRPGAVECHVELRFELEAADADGRFTASGLDDLRVSFDGREGDSWDRVDASLPAGRRVRVEARYSLNRGDSWPVLVPALGLRHPALGETWRFYGARDRVRVEMPRGEGLRVEGDVSYEGSGLGGLAVSVGDDWVRSWPHDASSWADVEVELRHEAEPFANGGPVVLFGGRLLTDAPGGAPLLGLGYEVGLVEHLVLSLWFQTDFESIAQALVVEVVSPGIFILPSFGAGVGLVLTELGPRGVDAAMRLRLSLSSWSLGFVADFDYYPSAGSWSIGLAGRIGI